MYSRYMQNRGFFEPEYTQGYSYARERQPLFQPEPLPEAAPVVKQVIEEVAAVTIPEKPRHNALAREQRLEARRKDREEREVERERQAKERRESNESQRRSRRGSRDGKQALLNLKKSAHQKTPKGTNLLDSLGLDMGDILLILVLLYLYQESEDTDMLILLGILFLG